MLDDSEGPGGVLAQVVACVVGEHSLDADGVIDEERLGPLPEAGAGGTALVAENLGVGGWLWASMAEWM